ncbi:MULTISPECIES: dTMP kinase [Roseomonadaceae]|uniref:Thymidylate kinase n=1 Tax=Falsiroseomonas oleicola TaxID=2801474 RepID=A0ABS6HG84_9PROT|nr:dTMP kinase [Roseomonas oleicola]MBU8546958.1 dTMP kinase [Roseomonas oleicola]
MQGPGRFITLEGGEGAGKSTQARCLATHLARRGLPVLLTREPGGAPGAEAMRRLLLGGSGLDPLAEALLVFAARRDHLVSTIRPALAAGMWVISDRFVDSTRAYQGAGQGVDGAAIDSLAAIALEGRMPDLTLVLDLPVATGMARARQRGVAADRYERLDTAFHQRIRDAFLAIAAAEPARCAVVDATPDAGAVARDIAALLDTRLP